MDKKLSRTRTVYAYSNWPTIIIDEKMSKELAFKEMRGASSRSKKRVEKRYEQFRSNKKGRRVNKWQN